MHGRIFNVHKFRSMRQDAEAATGAGLGVEDGRPAGHHASAAFLRRTRLDELPQLWNVLRRRHELRRPAARTSGVREQLTTQIPFYGQRHVVRPGLTGWAQVRYSYGATSKTRSRSCSSTCSTSRTSRSRSTSSSSLRRSRPSSCGGARERVHGRRADAPIVNAMSVDVEDYFHVSVFDGIVPRSRWTQLESRVCANTDRLLDLFDDPASQHVLRPRLGRRAPPGAGARDRRARPRDRVARLRPSAGLRPDARQRSATTSGERKRRSRMRRGRAVHGYRAPSYFVTPRSLWALDILIEEGYGYDASIFPIRHDRYGIPVSPRQPYQHPRGRRAR